MRRFLITAICLSLLAVSGCTHRVSFEDIAYAIDDEQRTETLIVVLDPATEANRVPIRAFMTGIAHSWEAEPGAMLRDVADVEFPQMFASYRVVPEYEEPPGSGVTLALTVPHYQFAEFHATTTVRAIAYAPGRTVLFDRSYTESGPTQGAKMFWGGAFGMKSAIRQSSFAAYKKIFERLRSDLRSALSRSAAVIAMRSIRS